MGVFDTYNIDCPHCSKTIESQSKPGNMNDYYFGKDPIQDIKFAGFYTCYYCKNSFTVEIANIPKMIIKKYEETNENN